MLTQPAAAVPISIGTAAAADAGLDGAGWRLLLTANPDELSKLAIVVHILVDNERTGFLPHTQHRIHPLPVPFVFSIEVQGFGDRFAHPIIGGVRGRSICCCAISRTAATSSAASIGSYSGPSASCRLNCLSRNSQYTARGPLDAHANPLSVQRCPARQVSNDCRDRA